MGLVAKIKKSFFFTQLEVGKYTKRRTSTMPEYDTKSREFYEKNYVDGSYLHRSDTRVSRGLPSPTSPTFTPRPVARSKSQSVRCSETYNLS
ncbi:hypothetical protein IWQ60_009712 [Tieghemiomyces parasiticus]|uniref:Uncharacterized protein n=1 Tax=Tieghemiomyces parasiticus TaxID=78921 RepID=A0A9W8DKQ1_9FUNG|nr:hypothetical protein IWQ60_009712 [Tieghemiomyces parasiticus]